MPDQAQPIKGSKRQGQANSRPAIHDDLLDSLLQNAWGVQNASQALKASKALKASNVLKESKTLTGVQPQSKALKRDVITPCADGPKGSTGQYCTVQSFMHQMDIARQIVYAAEVRHVDKVTVDLSTSARLGIKVMRGRRDWEREMSAIHLLESILSPGGIKRWTTIRKLNGLYGMTSGVGASAFYGIVQEPCTTLSTLDSTGIPIQADMLHQQIGEFLKIIHSRGVVHKDLKPANIVYCRGTFKLIDFDRLVSRDSVEFMSFGTTDGYRSPEFSKKHRVHVFPRKMYSTGMEMFYDHYFPDWGASSSQSGGGKVSRGPDKSQSVNPPSMIRPKRTSDADFQLLVYNDLFSFAVTLCEAGMQPQDPRVVSLMRGELNVSPASTNRNQSLPNSQYRLDFSRQAEWDSQGLA